MTQFEFTPPGAIMDEWKKLSDTIERQTLRMAMVRSNAIENAIKEGLEKGCGVLVIDPGSPVLNYGFETDTQTLTMEQLIHVSPMIPKGVVWYAPSKDAAFQAIEDNEMGGDDIGRPVPSICGLW